MTQEKTAREMLAWIEKKFFKGAGLAKASLLKGDERRAYKLAQVERLLTDRYGNPLMALYLSDQFWTADEGRVPMPWEHTTPIPKPEIAGLCHDLGLHFTFDLKEAFGVKNDWWVSNKQLVEWLTTTPYEQIAMHTAYIMRKFAIGVYEYGHYQPAQDAMAELFSSEYHELVREPNHTEMPPRAYVKTIIDELLRIERHWQRGRRLKLRPDLIILHDEIYGMVPRQFDKGVLEAAQALYDYMDKELYGRLVLKDYDYNASSWSEQPESVRRITAEVLNRFAAKVREVRAQYLAEGWIADGSLEFAYLMAHAENCGYGIWREEDDAL